ncbi:MAG: hypothetical protein JHC22_05100 [Thermoproteus sp.]|nr:hypothetical protein [Thermoproteus sp.]
MEKRYRFLDYYAVAASLGVLISLFSFLSSEPRPIYAALAAALAATAIVALFEWTCGYVKIFVVDDEKVVAVCLGRRRRVASRAEVQRLLLEKFPLYSRLSFIGRGKAGHVEAPGYVAEKLARDVSAWWDVDVDEALRPIPFLPPLESRP